MTPTLEAQARELARGGHCECLYSCDHFEQAILAALQAAHAEGARTHARTLDEGVQWNDGYAEGYAKGHAEGARQALEDAIALVESFREKPHTPTLGAITLALRARAEEGRTP